MCLDTLYYIIDEYLRNSFHKEDKQCEMGDSEIIFTYVISFHLFAGNYSKTLAFLGYTGLIRNILSRSRYSTRLNRLESKIEEIMGLLISIIQDSREYCIDSFPVPVCKNIRIKRSKIVKGEEYRGKNASKREYFYGFKVHLILAREGGVVEFLFTPGSYHDQISFGLMSFDLPDGSKLYGDKAFNNYLVERLMKEGANINLLPIRKANSKKSDNKPYVNYYRENQRKIVETEIAEIQKLFPKKIHATNGHGFLMKLLGFILAYNFCTILS